MNPPDRETGNPFEGWESAGIGHRVKGQRAEVANIEQQNKEPQNDEVITLKFPPEADSIFCGSERRYLRRSQF
jgi:hypothetical protein